MLLKTLQKVLKMRWLGFSAIDTPSGKVCLGVNFGRFSLVGGFGVKKDVFLFCGDLEI